MKQIITDLYWDARSNLERLHKDKMSLLDRIAYEKALVQLEMMKKMLSNCEITFKS